MNGRRRPVEDPKVTALREARCLNPHPEAVRDEAFGSQEFFDARDVVQVKYEMVRRVKADGASVTEAAAAFGYSRPSFYQAAAALEASGLDGLVPAKPGPRGRHKLSEPIVAWVDERLSAEPGLRAAEMVEQVAARYGVRVHPRSIERAVARYREQRSKSS
jgi:transposase